MASVRFNVLLGLLYGLILGIIFSCFLTRSIPLPFPKLFADYNPQIWMIINAIVGFLVCFNSKNTKDAISIFITLLVTQNFILLLFAWLKVIQTGAFNETFGFLLIFILIPGIISSLIAFIIAFGIRKSIGR